METDYNNALSMDIQNLISCIHWHGGSENEQVVLETLKTITDICANESCGRDALREESGLDFLVEFMFTTDNAVFLEHSLKTLACVIDENIHNQMYMTKKAVFEVIQTILRNLKFPVITRKNAIILISAILYQNSTAQSLICEVGLLQDLLNAYEQGAERMLSGSSYAPTADDPLNELWITSNSALCFAVNNPKHETNQEICSSIFPVSLRILELCSNADIIGSVSSLLSLCISNNRYCQDKFSRHDGLLVCKRFLQKHFDSVLADIKDCNNVIGKAALQMISNVIGVISAAASEHEKNAALLGKLGVVSLLVKLLFVRTLDINLKTKIMLSLGHSIDAYCTNKSYVLEIENFDNLLKENLLLENQELSSACKYLLQVCLMQEEISDQEENIAMVDNFVGVNTTIESFKKDSKGKNKSPEMKKICMATKERSSKKRYNSCISSPKSKDDCSQTFSLKCSNSGDKSQPKRSRRDTNEEQRKPVDLSFKHSFSSPRKDIESTENNSNHAFSSLKDLKKTANNPTLRNKSFNTPSKTLNAANDKENQESESSSDSSSTYYSTGTLLKKMRFENQSQIEPSNASPLNLLTNKNIFQNTTPRKKMSCSKFTNACSKGENEHYTPFNSQRQLLMDKVNFKEPDFQPSQKKIPFKFDPVLATPRSQAVSSSNKQIRNSNSNFTSTYAQPDEQFDRLNHTISEAGIRTGVDCSNRTKNFAGSPPLSRKRSAISSLSREKAKRVKGLSSPSTSGIHRSPCELSESYSNKCVQVIVIPGDRCKEHNLISSFEALQVVPLDEVQRL